MKSSEVPALKRLPEVVRVLKGRKEVLFAYLFGSTSRGKAGALSDIDVAIYLNPKLKEMTQVWLDIASELSFKDVHVDLILLNTASYRLAFEAIKGKLLFSRDESARKEFVYRTIRTYLDRRYYDLLRASLLEKKLRRGN